MTKDTHIRIDKKTKRKMETAKKKMNAKSMDEVLTNFYEIFKRLNLWGEMK